MSILFLVGAFLLLAVGLFVLVQPVFFNKSLKKGVRDDQSLAAQLGELDQIHSAGFLDQESHPEMRLETQRAALLNQSVLVDPKNSRANTIAVLIFLALSPVCVAAIYFNVGAPFPQPDAMVSQQNGAGNSADPAAPEQQQMIAQMVNRLSERLEQNPDDIDGWRMMGRSRAVLGEMQASIDAYKRVIEISDAQVSDWKALARVQLAAGGAEFSADSDFLTSLAEIDKRAPDDVFVLYYRGGAARLTGNLEAALVDWKKMLDRMPEGIPARETLQILVLETQEAANARPSATE